MDDTNASSTSTADNDAENTGAATYARLFPEQLADRCSPDALQANSGPAAYLHALYQQTLALEATSKSAQRFTLVQRRPDIGELLIDQASLDVQVPPLTLAIKALTRQAQQHAGAKDLPELIAQAGGHAGLPFHYPLAQIKAILAYKKLPLFEVLQQSDSEPPAFCDRRLTTPRLRQVMRNACGLSPATQQLLQDTRWEAADACRVYGLRSTTSKWEPLQDVAFFCRQTGLGPEALLDALAISGVANDATEGFSTVKRSAAYAGSNNSTLDGHLYGASFINNGRTPTATVQDTQAGDRVTLQLKNTKPKELVRLYQMVQLQRALRLPFADVDLLVMSIIKAENRKGWNHIITDKTLRALGVFRYLNDRYGVTAEQFAAIVHQVSPYSVEGRVPMLDRVLDGPSAGQAAGVDGGLVIDAREFELETSSDDPNTPSIVSALCRVSGTNEQLTRLYIGQAMQALGLKKPVLSLDLISSLYRQSRLSRLFRRSLVEGTALLALLGLQSPHPLKQLAGKPSILTEGDEPDILDILVALANLDQWLRQQNMLPSQLLRPLSPLPPNTAPASLTAPALPEAIAKQQDRLRGTQLTEAQLQDAAGPVTSLHSGTWLETLGTYIDEQGLVKDTLPQPEARLEKDLATLLASKLKSIQKPNNPDDISVREPGKPKAGGKADDDMVRQPQDTYPADTQAVAAKLATLLANVAVAQEDLARGIVSLLLRVDAGPTLQSEYGLPLLEWVGSSRHTLLASLLNVFDNDGTASDELTQLHQQLRHRCQLLDLLRVSPGVLSALLEHPEWFALETKETTAGRSPWPAPDLGISYRLRAMTNWVEACRSNGIEESKALDWLARSTAERPQADRPALEELLRMIGWESEANWLLSRESHSENADISDQNGKPSSKPKPRKTGTWNQFIATLGDPKNTFWDENQRYILDAWAQTQAGYEVDAAKKAVVDKLDQFIAGTSEEIVVTQQQYDLFKKIDWAITLKAKNKPVPLKLVLSESVPIDEELPPPTDASGPALHYAPRDIDGIDYILRLKRLSEATGLSSQSLLSLSLLRETSNYWHFHAVAQRLLGTCNDEALAAIEPGLQEQWRDALVAYLMSAWVLGNASLGALVTATSELSSYFLTDIGVSSEARPTTVLSQAIASLQHYLFRLFSHLEPGYEASNLPEGALDSWQRYLSQYGTWKQWRTQLNHPENLIYYANRPNKTTAFEELEVEVNQGKLDTELLHTAVCNYLTKFERLSNLQVVSGYLDGQDPENDTYYLIGKTNASPTEYYWRSVDMGLRDDQQRLSPLAWSEWKKIGLTVSGKIAQSSYTETVEHEDKTKTSTTYVCDAIRPVIIAGRPYVFWVERGVTGLPSADAKNQTPTKYKRLSVQYIYLQSDGFWSTSNELMCLDGTKDGVRPTDQANKYVNDENNAFLKDETYIPGLIAFLNVEGDLKRDPWLTVILYNCDKSEIGALNSDYFIEMRDLLLIEKKILPSSEELAKTAYESYKDLRRVQHIYDGKASNFQSASPFRTEIIENTVDPSFFKKEMRSANLSKLISFKSNLAKQIVKITFYDPASTISDQRFTLWAKKPLDSKFRLIEMSATTKTEEDFALSSPNRINRYEGEYTFEQTGIHVFRMRYLQESDNKNDQYVADYYLKFILAENTDEHWHITISQTNQQAQYLALASANVELLTLPFNKVRLNTLFGKQLVARASESVERALGWDTQKLKEPTIDETNPDPVVDFHGANGLYFRELFLHLPALIATRLTEQQQFEDAEAWYLRNLFDPYRTRPTEDGRPAYWNTRPLAEVGTARSELTKAVDPVARAFILSRYYRQAVFLNLMENWQRQGDHFYRQLTLSSLNHAWLCYQQALKLIGPLPERTAVSRWKPTPLSQVSEGSFLTPVNTRVIEAKKLLESRLYNLRHGLTIDGKALPDLGWGSEDVDPFSSAQGGLSIVTGSYNSDKAVIPAYRFRQLLPTARAAAQQLLDLGRHYMKLMEDEFNTTLDVLLKSQEIRISDFTLRLKKEAINGVIAKRRTLELSRQAASYRQEFYTDLIQTGRSTREEAATALLWTAGTLMAFSSPLKIVEGSVKTIPTIFGMAMGGSDMSGPVGAAKEVVEGTASFLKFTSEQLLVESEYERRAHQWEFEKQMADWDIKLVDNEIAELNIERHAAEISLEESKQERANLEEAYVAMTTGFTIIPIYNWLVARQELLYGAAYDAVLSLCLSLEAAWRYEIGDYKREAFIKTSAWSDSYKGMLAGESLLVDLQEMENAYLLANERRLTIKKTFSLKAIEGEAGLKTGIRALADNKPLSFGFTAENFDRNYPGHYLRQLKHVSVSLVVEPGNELGEVSAILTQTGNTTLVEPDQAGAIYCYERGDKLPASIKRNLRAQQQIALSSSVSEDGLGYAPGEWVYELMFHDGRYLPFEGTGAISQWQLEIPDIDFAKSLLKGASPVLSDIQINLVYTALSGTNEFTQSVVEVRNRNKESKQPEGRS